MEIDCATLKRRLDQGDDIFILDVRNPDEYAESRMDGSVLIPLGELPDRVSEVPKDREVVVHCKAGMRSQRAIDYLREHHGYTNLKNLKGGILAWNALG